MGLYAFKCLLSASLFLPQKLCRNFVATAGNGALVPGNLLGTAVISEGDVRTGQHRGRRIKGTVSFSDCRGKEKDRKWSYLFLLTVPTLCGVTAAVRIAVRLLSPAPTLPVPTPALAGTLQNKFV